MSRKKPPVAQVFPPGDFIREELEARGWTQGDLARFIGRPLQAVNAIVNAKKEITPETAVALGAAFGTSAEVWLRLETTYRLAQAGAPDPAIRSRVQEFELVSRKTAERTTKGHRQTLNRPLR
jgi:HTH-type transcriptional regulator / antitoxin HigA